MTDALFFKTEGEDERYWKALKKGEEAFFSALSEMYPECETNVIPRSSFHQIYTVGQFVITDWLELNLPKNSPLLKELHGE